MHIFYFLHNCSIHCFIPCFFSLNIVLGIIPSQYLKSSFFFPFCKCSNLTNPLWLYPYNASKVGCLKVERSSNNNYTKSKYKVVLFFFLNIWSPYLCWIFCFQSFSSTKLQWIDLYIDNFAHVHMHP